MHVIGDISAELGKVLTAVHVSTALDLDHFLLFVVLETRVAIAPALEIEVEILDLTVNVVINDLRVSLSIDLELLRAFKRSTRIAHASKLIIQLAKSVHLNDKS